MIYFDICEFSYTDSLREIIISLDRVKIRISQNKITGTDFWIVSGRELGNALKEHYLNFQPMFFGILLTTLHEKKARMPICRVCLDDINKAYESQKMQELADSIATQQGSFL
ncbi:MAG: hypothetical protein KGO49_02775 [Gammaproteobacteria bacterium]|nr:hypothetical protein [Gammaproteobacteria bacterium]